MQCRTRMRNVLSFQPVDRVPLVEWPIREATMTAWRAQGYPDGVDPHAFFGLDAFSVPVPIDFGMKPAFEERTLRQTAEYRIWQDALGAIRQDFIADATPGFVTRSWLSFPVKDRVDFHAMQERFRADAPDRYPSGWADTARMLPASAAPLHLSIPFLFWVARDWMGFEGLCTAFYDEPALVHEMFGFITDFVLGVLERGPGAVAPDIVELKEDMAYKHAPMISPEMFRTFMFPHYRRVVDFLKGRGARVIYVDCDGNPGPLIPLWIEAGVDGMSPCEAAAGVDPVSLRQRFPRFAMLGGIDKRALARGHREILDEVKAKAPLIEGGGYVPHVDHAIPPDVSLKNYLTYRGILERAVEGLPLTT
jgi:hypothetical protein